MTQRKGKDGTGKETTGQRERKGRAEKKRKMDQRKGKWDREKGEAGQRERNESRTEGDYGIEKGVRKYRQGENGTVTKGIMVQ